MEYDEIREAVCVANKRLAASRLALLTWGNVSAVDRTSNAMAIKPSGVSYDDLTPEMIVVQSLDTEEILCGTLRPSSDAATHQQLYLGFPSIGAVVHTHSHYATVWAQAQMEIPCLGTTHADHFCTSIPLTRELRKYEIEDGYEKSTGKVIVERFDEVGMEPEKTPAVLVASHGPFTWGETAEAAVENAIVLEETARMAIHTIEMNPSVGPLPHLLHERHFFRKHGDAAYYGQVSHP